MAVLRPGDRVLLREFRVFKGETIPNLSPDEWTGVIQRVWGIARTFCDVKRDYDGRVLSVMERDLEWIERKPAANTPRQTKSSSATEDDGQLVLFEI